eukprot:m.9068 g.9068  ORF g.9068 m.9068 type:complete len:305 (-) comp4004_c0_seq1:252-1166(-)
MAFATKSTQQLMGTFSMPSFTTVGDPYEKKAAKKADPREKGKQMMTTATRGKGATMDGYFGNSYARVFEKEPLSDTVKQRRKQEMSKRKKMLGPNYKPSGPTKSIGSAGSYEGTFAGKMEYFSGARKGKEKKKKESRNFLTNPPKKGSGFGYNNVTIGKLPEYKSSPYSAAQAAEKAQAKKHQAAMKAGAFKATAPNDPQGDRAYFDNNPYRQPKALGKPKKLPPVKKVNVPFYPTKPPPSMTSSGAKTGTFTKFEYTPEKPKAKGTKKPQKVFKPVSNAKGTPMTSIISLNVRRTTASLATAV